MKVLREILQVLVLIIVIGTAIVVFIDYREGKRRDTVIQELQKNNDITGQIDSIVSAREKQHVDSLKFYKRGVDSVVSVLSKETANLRRKNASTEKFVRDLANELGTRPEF